MNAAITYRKTKTGEWVAYGPAAAVKAGAVTVTKKDGTAKTEHIARLGKAFEVNGTEMVYGYIERVPARTTSYAPRPGRPGSGRCTDCGAYLAAWEIRDYVDACHDCAI